ncbi:hypothetical protein KX281_05075, partial [Escherichia coli]|nr:hypothetical protein [Escherichia coli]
FIAFGLLAFIFHCVTNNKLVKNSKINYTINYTVPRTISNNHEQRSTRFNRYRFPAIRYQAGGCGAMFPTNGGKAHQRNAFF